MKKLAFAFAVVALAACGGPQTPPPAVKPAFQECDGPAWTCFRSGPCPVAEFKGMLCAVGMADSIQSQSLGFEAAGTKARTEMGAVIKSKVDGFSKVVQESLSKQGLGEDAIQKVAGLSQNVVGETLVGVSIPKTWYNKETKVYYAMAMVDSKTLIESLKGVGQAAGLAEQVKTEIRQRADGVAAELEAERARLEGK